MSGNSQIIEHEKYWELPIGDKEVTRLIIDYGFALEIAHPDYNLEIRLIEDFVLSENGQEAVLSIDNPLSLAPGLALLKRPIASIKMTKTGLLEILFSDQTQISVKPNNQHEAWHIVGGPSLHHDGGPGLSGLQIICMPGGALAIWLPKADS
ncbi:MAG: hypothetical protein DPW16_00330 [Chloroflexi bacterium]|nr:hypothetical protein [Chloroflexota bacterium]